nr:hypothetical protein [Tanacetum cinerariifolium]
MAAVKVPQILEYKGGQLNVAPVLEVENFTHWKKRFMCHIIDDQINSVINCLTAKSTWDDLDFQDNPDDEEDIRSNHVYLKDLEEEYQARSLLAKSKRFFKKGTQRQTKGFETKYNKVKAKLAFLSSSASAPISSSRKNKGLIAKMYDWDEEEVSSDENELTEVKALMALTNEERIFVSKESASNDNSEVSITGSNKPKLSEAGDSTLSNHDTSNHLLPSLEKLTGAKHVSGPKTIKSILKSKSTFKAETLKGIIINEPSLAPAKGNKSSLVFKTNSAYAGKLKMKREALQAKKVESFKASNTESSSALRSKTPTKRKPFTRSLNMYKEYLAEFWYSAKTLENSKVFFSTLTGGIYGEVGVNTFRNAIGAHYLPHSRRKTGGFDQITNKDAIILYSLANRINIDYTSIFWEDIIVKLNKKHREKVIPYTRFLSLTMMHNMKEGYRDGELKLYLTQVFSINNWALKPNQPKKPPFITHMLAICSAIKPVTFKAPNPFSNVKRVPQGTKLGAKPRHKKHLTSSKQPFVSRVVSEARANPQLSSGMSAFNLNEPIYLASFIIHSESASGNNASAASTAKADPRNSAPNDFVPQQQETFNTIKLEDLAKLVSHGQPSFKDLDSAKDDHVIVMADSDEHEDDEVYGTKNVETKDTSVPKSLFPRTTQRAAGKVLKTEFLNILFAYDFSSSLPTELKDLPSKSDKLTKEVKGLKKQVHEMEIELLGDLKEIPTKLENFTKFVTSITSQVIELKTLQWELLAEFLSLPVLDYASSKAGDQSVPSVGQADTRPTEGGKDTNQATNSKLFQKREEYAKAKAAKQEGEVRKAEPVDLLGLEVVKKYYNDKLQYDKYCDIILNRRAVSRITNYDVLTRKGPITLKVYREDGTRMDYIHMSEVELGINLDIPLSKQDPLDKLNDFANKKRKHVDDIHDYFKANKRLKQDFVTIEDLKDFSSTMLYTVQEIFFRQHQGLRLDDHARTFSSLLLAEVDKRNLNPLKQMRVIEQLRQSFFSVSSSSPLKIGKNLHFCICSGTKSEEGLLKVYKAGKRLLYVKRNKAIFLGNVTSKVDYFPTIPRNNSPNSSNDLTKYLLDILIFSPLHDDPYMEAMQAYNAISPPQVIIALPAILPLSLVLSQSPISDSQDFFLSEEISPKDTETSVSPSSSVGSLSPIRSTISPLDYPFDEYIFTELDNSLWITPRPLGEKPVPEEPNESYTHLWK